MGFIEIDDLPDLIRGITHTEAWTALAPAFGLPDQLRLIGPAGTLFSATGLGPKEAVVLSQSQVLVVVTAIEVAGDEVHPTFTLILQTHADARSVESLRKKWVPLLSGRIFGAKIREASFQHGGIGVSEYLPDASGHSVLATNTGSLIYISNDRGSMEECLNSKLGATESVRSDPSFEGAKETLFANSHIFGYASRDGLGRFAKLMVYLFGGRFEAAIGSVNDFEPTIQDAVGSLFDGVAYSMTFADGLVAERTLLLLRPDVQARLTAILRPSEEPPRLLDQIPTSARSATIVRIKDPGQAIEDLLALISSKSNVVTSAVMREAVIALRQRYGIRPTDQPSKAFGEEFAWIHLNAEDESFFCAAVRDNGELQTFLPRYLSLRHLEAAPTLPGGEQLYTSRSSADGALLITGQFLLLGTKNDAIVFSSSAQRGMPIRQDVIEGKLLVTVENDAQRSALAILEASKLFRTTDGNPKHLDDPAVKDVLASIPPTIGLVSSVSHGIQNTTHSPLGTIASLIGLLHD